MGRWRRVVTTVALCAVGLVCAHHARGAQPSGGRGAPGEPFVQAQDADSLVARARRRLAEGFALSTAEDLAEFLSRDPSRASPELVLLAARAYSQARAWPAVRRLLSGRGWLDSLAGGEGRYLLAEAALSLGETQAAVEQFGRVVQRLARGGDAEQDSGGPAPLEALRARVAYARALEEAGRDSDAAHVYVEAAEVHPEIAHWLRLSAIQAFARAALPDSVLPLARTLTDARAVHRDSVWSAAAVAAFRSGDVETGVGLADSISSRAEALLAGEWIVPALLDRGDTAVAHATVERALRQRGVGEEAGWRYLALDSSTAALRRVAASDVREGRFRRAAELLGRVLKAATPDERPELALETATARFAAGDYAGTRRTLAPWTGGTGQRKDSTSTHSSTVARMRFLTGRSLYRQRRYDEAIEQWERVVSVPGARDAAYASFLIAEIHHDRGDLEESRQAYERTVARFPRSEYAGTSLVRLGMLSLLRGRSRQAVGHFDTYRRRHPGGNWIHAATYWSARSLELAGDSARARVLYREALGTDPLSYYGIRAAAALELDPWESLRLRATPRLPPLSPDRARLLERMRTLRELGWKHRALRELAARDRSGEDWVARLALARSLNEAGWTWQGTSMGWRIWQSRGGFWSEDLLRIVYPFNYGKVVAEVARRQNLDPSLAAALVRRESQYDRDIVSPAAAVGLMQVLPRTGAELARRAGVPEFRPEQLAVPEVNLALGGQYLKELLARNGGALVPALISYNAGPHRYARWKTYPEFNADVELMIDRIPFSETRRYVKAIIAYRYIYGRLHGLGTELANPVDGAATTR